MILNRGRTRAALAFLVAATVIAIPWYFVARTMADASPVVAHPPIQATAVVWGGRVFASSEHLRLWLSSRGASYRVWGERHRPASRVLAGNK